MTLYLCQNSSSHFNIQVRNASLRFNILVCNPTFMFTIEHWSWQCNIPFDKVSGHNSYIQVRNAICKMTIHRAKGQSNILGDNFYQQRNNSTCDVTIQDVRWHINHQGNNSTCDVTIWTWSWQCNIQHALWGSLKYHTHPMEGHWRLRYLKSQKF